jgi:hypothetical protein
MTKNLDLWDRVATSDPQYLKAVAFGARKFTAIDPQYQVRCATEEFGPVGTGWGWNSQTEFHHMANGDCAVVSLVRIWHDDRDFHFGPFPGCRKFFDAAKGKMFEDAPKMSVTDGLTKGLSHLGFNADVFLGKHDGNKYTSNTGGTDEDW